MNPSQQLRASASATGAGQQAWRPLVPGQRQTCRLQYLRPLQALCGAARSAGAMSAPQQQHSAFQRHRTLGSILPRTGPAGLRLHGFSRRLRPTAVHSMSATYVEPDASDPDEYIELPFEGDQTDPDSYNGHGSLASSSAADGQSYPSQAVADASAAAAAVAASAASHSADLLVLASTEVKQKVRFGWRALVCSCSSARVRAGQAFAG